MIKLSDILKGVKGTSKSITEIGDASAKPYKWELVPSSFSNDTDYEFTTDLGTEYQVNLSTGTYRDEDTNESKLAAWIMFLVAKNVTGNTQDTETGDTKNQPSGKEKRRRTMDEPEPPSSKEWSTIVSTNKGELYRVMATVTNIVKKYLGDNPSIKIVVYEPSKKASEQEFGTQRDMLYRAFIKQAIPSAQILKKGDNIIAKIK